MSSGDTPSDRYRHELHDGEQPRGGAEKLRVDQHADERRVPAARSFANSQVGYMAGARLRRPLSTSSRVAVEDITGRILAHSARTTTTLATPKWRCCPERGAGGERHERRHAECAVTSWVPGLSDVCLIT